MIITCPSCLKRYSVEDNLIGDEGRQVQCVSCNNIWVFSPSRVVQESHTSKVNVKKNDNSRKSKSGLYWFLLLSVIALCGSGLYLMKKQVLEVLPQSKVLYDFFHSPKINSLCTLKIQDLNYSINKISGGKQKITLSGIIVNYGKVVQRVRPLKVTIKGDCRYADLWHKLLNKYIERGANNKCALGSWSYEPSESKVYPGEKLSFETKSDKLFLGGDSIKVQFN